MRYGCRWLQMKRQITDKAVMAYFQEALPPSHLEIYREQSTTGIQVRYFIKSREICYHCANLFSSMEVQPEKFIMDDKNT
jgi:hypothetical protein